MSQTLLPLPSPVSYAEADYVVTDVNRTLFDSLLQPDKWGSYGCLLIGETASGKTHLARIWQQHFAATWCDGTALSKSAALDSPYLVIDSIEAVGATDVFHLLNRSRESGQKLLLTASSEPKKIFTLPDVLSRLNALFALYIPLPDENLSQAILYKCFADRQLRVDSDVIQYILTRCERSYGALAHLVQALDRSSLIKRQGVTIPLVKQALEINS